MGHILDYYAYFHVAYIYSNIFDYKMAAWSSKFSPMVLIRAPTVCDQKS